MNTEFRARLEDLERDGLGEPLDGKGFWLLAVLTLVIPLLFLLAGWMWL